MKFYIELDGSQFIVEADSPQDAIVMLWERRADTCRNLQDILPEYWIHTGVVTLGDLYESFPAYWLLSESAMHLVFHLLQSELDVDTFNDCCKVLLSHHPSKV